MFTITTSRHGTVIATHTAGTLDAAHLDILTDGMPATMPLKDAVSLLGQVTAEGGTIQLPDGVRIDVEPDEPGGVGVACGNCGGNVLMLTCNRFRGSGHEWVLGSVCMICRAVHWVESGCEDCKAAENG